MSGSQIRPKDLPWLTIARFPAAVWIMTVHTQAGVKDLLPAGGLGRALSLILDHGGLCVAFFFALSGFILTYVHAGDEPFDKRRYFVARVARVWPIYAVALLVSLPILFRESSEVLALHGTTGGTIRIVVRVLAVLTWTQAWSPSIALAWCLTAWSLSCEVFFYAVFPWLMARLKNISSAVLWALVAACLGVMVGRFAAYQVVPNLHWNFNPLVRLPEFAAGIAMAILFRRGFRLDPWWMILTLGAVFGSAAVPGLAIPLLLVQHLGILGTVFALASIPERPLSKPLRTLERFGLVSYTLYLFHATFFEYYPASWWKHPIGWILCSAATIAISYAAHQWIETPARRWIMGKFLPSSPRGAKA